MTRVPRSAVTQLRQVERHFGPRGSGAQEGAHLVSLVVKATFNRENLRSLLDFEILRRKALRYIRLVMNLRELRSVSRLLAEDSFKEIPRVQPAFPFKFLHERFLCRNLSSRNRLRCLMTNLRFWKSTLTADALEEIAAGRSCTIFDAHNPGCRVSIVFGLSSPSYLEGEMSVVLKVDERETYIISFTVVPGRVVGCNAAHALLISRVQGTKGALVACRRAQEVLGIQPVRAVLDAVQGLAMAARIEWLCAVRAESQPFYTPGQHDVFKAAYDNFFEDIGMSATLGSFFRSYLPIPRSPICAVNRRRARKRQAARKALIEAVRARAVGLCRDRDEGDAMRETTGNTRGVRL